MLVNYLHHGLKVFGIAIAAIAIFPSVAQADNVYADLPTLNSITFTPSRGTTGTAIPLTANTALSPTSVGNVNVQSNTYGGFKVEVESTNFGLLKHSSGAGMAYTLNYNNSEKGQITTKTVVEDNSALITDCADSSGCDRDVKISISQSEVQSKPAGFYSDTLTFTLTNK
ncbi:hypothetical protein V2H45_10135 [Tumidithrix elongata RA019]|uniref:Secreted protein n=1 Tax=Tumidithrix elongata BACA0141 TaxID=2716417 RepID=A0AAW9PZT6_9CYAN|nr:hypothetical protein [Tumidithrix elongata RA019]